MHYIKKKALNLNIYWILDILKKLNNALIKSNGLVKVKRQTI